MNKEFTKYEFYLKSLNDRFEAKKLSGYSEISEILSKTDGSDGELILVLVRRSTDPISIPNMDKPITLSEWFTTMIFQWTAKAVSSLKPDERPGRWNCVWPSGRAADLPPRKDVH